MGLYNGASFPAENLPQDNDLTMAIPSGLLRAIRTHWFDNLDCPLYFARAPAETSKAGPYCVVSLRRWEPFRTFREKFERIEVQFNLRYETRSVAQPAELAESLLETFDDADLEVEGYHLIRFQRIEAMLDWRGEGWTFTVGYLCELERQAA